MIQWAYQRFDLFFRAFSTDMPERKSMFSDAQQATGQSSCGFYDTPLLRALPLRLRLKVRVVFAYIGQLFPNLRQSL